MEICVTYLYFLAKKSKSYAGGAPPREVSKFRNYAATYWTVHFGEVCSSIQSKDLPYYQGLCHPRFPGFHVWLESRGLFIDDFGISEDEMQNRIIGRLRLDPSYATFSGDDSLSAPFDREEFGGHYVGPLKSPEAIYTSNPSALSNHNFPTRVDKYGFVSLEYETAHSARRNADSANVIPAKVVIKGFPDF